MKPNFLRYTSATSAHFLSKDLTRYSTLTGSIQFAAREGLLPATKQTPISRHREA